MKNKIYVKGIMILLSIMIVFGAIPCRAETVDNTEDCCCIEHPEYAVHDGCLPVVEGFECENVENSGFAMSYSSFPLSWNTEDDYTILTSEEQENCEVLYEGFKSLSAKINLKHIMLISDVASLFKRVIYSSPELFYVEASYGYYTTLVDSVKYVVAVAPIYTMEANEVETATEFVGEEIEKLAGLCDASWSDIEKVLFYHDYLALHFSYDKRLYTQGSDYVNYDVYNFLKDGTGVCMAYQGLLMAILDKLGVENTYAENGGHIWNVVKINDNWYHVDSTFDDPIVNSTEYNGFHGLAKHDYFLKSDTYFAANDYDTWNCDYTCSDTSYDAISTINNAYSAFVIRDEGWYYIDEENAKLMLYDDNTGTSTSIASISPTLTVCYASVFGYGDYIIYNGAYSLFSYDTVNKTTKTLQTKSASGYILGFTVSDSVIDYVVSTGFAESSWVHETYSLCDSVIGHATLKDFSTLIIDEEKNLIENVVSSENTLSEVKEMFANASENIIIRNSDGEEVSEGTAKIGTGYTVTYLLGGVEQESYTVIVDCDTDGDGYVTVADASIVYNDLYGQNLLEGIYRNAADFADNEIISVIDVMNILNCIA